MNETDRAYIAGLIDGEGSISISGSYVPRLGRKHICLGVKISMQSEEAIAFFAQKVGVNKYKSMISTGAYQCVLWQKKAKDLLVEIMPYLITKRDRAQFAIWFYEVSFERESKRFGNEKRGARPLSDAELTFRELCAQIMMLLNKKDSLLFHGKSGEFGEKLNTLKDQLKCMLTPSQAVEGNGSTEGVTTTEVSPNNNPLQETPTVH